MVQDQVRFDGRAILITGAGRGLGRSHALLLASRGAKIVVADNGAAMDGSDASTAPALSVAAEIEAAGGDAVACTSNIASESGSEEAVVTSLKAFGRIDAILHNASTAPDLTSVDKISSHDFEAVMRVNPFAGLWMTRAAWPYMVKQNYGRILYMTSGAIFGAEGNAIYAAAKSAYIGMMRSLAPEGAKHGILVNLISPTARTRMTERFPPSPYADWFFKMMLPERVSVGAAYLLSEGCKITGEMFSIGGGRIGRILLGEDEGYRGDAASIEEVRDAMPGVMAGANYFFAKNLGERSTKQAELLGYRSEIGADALRVKPIGKN